MQFNNLIIPSDSTGCSFYRMTTPYWSVRSFMRNVNFVETNKYVFSPEWYQGFTMCEIQRHVHDFHAKVVLEFLKPISEQIGFHLVYNIDDVIIGEDIPKWNMAFNAYNQPTFKNNIQNMMKACDFVVVTTNELKEYYHKKLDIPLKNFIVIPNCLPRWWVGEAFNVDRSLKLWFEHKKRPRIGITSSITHFDIMNQSNGDDDFSDIVDFIRSTVQQYEWCFIGGCPPKLKDLAESKQISIYPGSDILNFMREVNDKEFQAIVVPLKDCVFNQCKSNIKLLEAWALGIPVIAQDICTYNKYTHRVFNNADELQNQLDSIFKSKEWYRREILANRQLIDFGTELIPDMKYGAWLEKNITPWMRLFTMSQRTLSLDLNKHKTNNGNNQIAVK